jgi:ribonucleoside-diphosphate reductase alpha chain
MGLKVEKRFDINLAGNYNHNIISRITDVDGSIVFNQEGITAPAHWSQTAIDILAQKYFRRTGVPRYTKKVKEAGIPERYWRSVPDEKMLEHENGESWKETGFTRESSAHQVFHRLAGAWTYWGCKGGYFTDQQSADEFYNAIYYMLYFQIVAPNSPQWFNTGLHWAYGIDTPSDGHYYYDEKAGKAVKSTSKYERPQPHACFITPVKDNLVGEEGIFSWIETQVRLFKHGSGAGSNISTIRGKGEKLSGGGVSSGLMSFLDVRDAAGGAIKSGGTTRRSAMMLVLDEDHPEILDFINWKVKEEDKVAMMVTGSHLIRKYLTEFKNNPENFKHIASRAVKDGVPARIMQTAKDQYDLNKTFLDIDTVTTDWQGKAYATVSGQNSNNSVRLSNKVIQDYIDLGDAATIQLKNRTDGKLFKELKSKELFEAIGYAAWRSADPGIHFKDTIQYWHTCKATDEIKSSNPCSEFLFLDNTACNLASINLSNVFKRKNIQNEDIEDFIYICRLWTYVLEISVYLAQFPTKNIAEMSYKFRPLGLGFANIGGCLMKWGVPYDSDYGRDFCSLVSSIMTSSSYNASIEMAKILGAFQGYEQNRVSMLDVMDNHSTVMKRMLRQQDTQSENHHLFELAVGEWEKVVLDGSKYGFRNAQATVIAPTGTIGLVMDCDTTGIEPDFALVKFKKLAGGGYRKIVNQSVTPALQTKGYNSEEIGDIIGYIIGNPQQFMKSPHINPISLMELGFSSEWIGEFQNNLETSFDISFVPLPKIPDNVTKKSDLGRGILDYFNLTSEQIKEINRFLFGTMTIENAPHLKDSDLSIFDCANKCGVEGRRFLSADAHIKMMAAAQPFISGAISKTVNLPSTATPKDCLDIYLKSHALGLKAVALYVDGSKLSQPLNAKFDEAIEDAGEIIKNVASNIEHILTRKNLPNKRTKGYTQKVKLGGQKFYIRTGEYDNGELGEVFIDLDKEGSALKGILSAFSITVSIALQYGVPLDAIVDKLLNMKFEPAGMVQCHENIKSAQSIIDLVMRDLAVNYLGRYDVAQVKPEHSIGKFLKPSKSELSKQQGYTGDACPECGNFTLVMNGTCKKCNTCGVTTGCS